MNDRPDAQLSGDLAMTPAAAAVAFLAYVIRYVRGWLLVNRSIMFRDRTPVWSVNVGLPAASYDDSTLVSAYRRVAAASLLLANLEAPIVVEMALRLLADEQVSATAASAEQGERLGIAVIPETAAGVTGFAKSTHSAPGVYLMVDVGAMTLDVCAFRLVQQSKGRFPIYTAQVRPLGVEAFHWFIGSGKTEEGFSEQCNRCLWGVIWDTRTQRARLADCWNKGNDLPIFLVGGGAFNELHRGLVGALSPWLKEHAKNDGTRMLDLPTAPNLDCPEPLEHFGRLAVAWGLSYPPTEIGEPIPPSKIADIPPPRVREFGNRYVSKDDV